MKERRIVPGSNSEAGSEASRRENDHLQRLDDIDRKAERRRLREKIALEDIDPWLHTFAGEVVGQMENEAVKLAPEVIKYGLTLREWFIATRGLSSDIPKPPRSLRKEIVVSQSMNTWCSESTILSSGEGSGYEALSRAVAPIGGKIKVKSSKLNNTTTVSVSTTWERMFFGYSPGDDARVMFDSLIDDLVELQDAYPVKVPSELSRPGVQERELF